MVHLLLACPNGNQGLRHFPFTGLLGLTPVLVQGFVATRLDADAKPLRAKSISVAVRCYESRIAALNATRSNVLAEYSQTLWSKPDHLDYHSITDLTFPFHIAIPTTGPGFSTAIFVDYRCVWRVEAGPSPSLSFPCSFLPYPPVLLHEPLYGVGSVQVKHFNLPLIRYDVPPHYPAPSRPILDCLTNSPRAPRISYCVHTPTSPIGPRDSVSINICLLPLEPDIVVRSASLTIERRIRFKDDTQSTRTPLTALSSPIMPPANAKRKRPATAPVSSKPYIFAPPRIVSDVMARAESSGRFSRDKNDIWSNVLTLQWPAAKSRSRWAIGETIDGRLATVKFLVHVKVNVTSPAGLYSIELAEKELLVVSTSEAERKQAAIKYADHLKTEEAKPPRPRKGQDDHNGHGHASLLIVPKLRRPHTSAGQHDGLNELSGISYTLPRDIFRLDSRSMVRKRQTLKLPTTRSKMSVSSTSSSFDTDSDVVREWEEELVRIETHSRRLSDLVGFPWKRDIID
ncbi:hypothetical protein APHAL10511_007042 [Amanita phalloides]|nr:hypothetical protein APHAL10511_007042 [Amanita phalloides]